MSVTLSADQSIPAEGFDWCVTIGVGGSDPALAHLFEQTFTEIMPEWQRLARQWRKYSDAILSHAPSCAPNSSDFGSMLVWDHLVRTWAQGRQRILVCCDDPWLFRQLAAHEGVITATPPPALFVRSILLRLQGFVARMALAVKAVGQALAWRGQVSVAKDAPFILVYGHSASDAAGLDGYFGAAMRKFSELQRVQHTDTPTPLARRLVADGRTYSLNAWGCPLFALKLLTAFWNPPAKDEYSWLIRRLQVFERASAQGAAIRWQTHCQERWIAAVKPLAVVWPWENHGWERALVKAAAAHGARSIGYQHALVGRQELNYIDSGASPDLIFCGGAVNARQLKRFGHTSARLVLAGAIRYATPIKINQDQDGDVVFALPFARSVAREMIDMAKQLAAQGYRVLIKDHPMAPTALNSSGIETVDEWASLEKVSVVVYAAGTIGLEMALTGVPVVRYRPSGSLALIAEPDGIDLPTAGAGDLPAILADPPPPPKLDRDVIFSAPDWDRWREGLGLKGNNR